MLTSRLPSGSLKRLFFVPTLSCATLLSLTATSTAEELQTVLLSEQDFFKDVPIVLSATRLAQPKDEVPAAITVIDRELIYASGARDIPELFRMVAGFQMSYDEGHSPFASYHGLIDEFARRMQVLVDGRSIYMPFHGGVQWSDLPLAMDDIERIEIIRGPNSATYGANAFLGVINIITRHASETIGSYAHLNSGTTEALDDAYVRYGNTTGDFDYRVTLGYQDDTGFRDRVDGRQVKFASFRGDYRAGINDIFNFQIGYNNAVRDAGYTTSETDPPHDIFVDSSFEQIRWWRSFKPGSELQVQVYHNRHDQREDFATLPTEVDLSALGLGTHFVTVPLNYDILTERYDIEAQHTWQPAASWRAVWGASARRDRVKSPTYMATSEAVENDLYRLFGNIEWRIRPSLTTNIGAMYENNGITGEDVSPRVALNYQVRPGHTLRTSVSTAIRNPVLYEEKIDYRITTEIAGLELYDQVARASGGLSPERILSREMGYLYTRENLSMDFKLFSDDIKDIITAFYVPDPNDARNQKYEDIANDETATISGAETQIDFRYANYGRLLFAYAYIDIDSSDNHRVFSQSAPRHSASLVVSHRFTNPIARRAIHASAGYYYYEAMVWLSEGDPVDDVHRLDFRVAQQFKLGRTDLDLALVLQNVLDPYIEFRNESDGSKNEFNTRAYVSLAMEFL